MNIEENNKVELLESLHRLKDALSNTIIELEEFNSIEAANEAKEILEREKLTLNNILFEDLDLTILDKPVTLKRVKEYKTPFDKD